MADYLRRLVARASEHPVIAPPVRPVAPPRDTTADDGVDGIVEVLPSPTPPVGAPLRAVPDSRPLHEPRAGSPPGVAPRPVAMPHDVAPVPREPRRRPTPEPATELSTSETVRRPAVPPLRQEPVPHVTPLSPPTSTPAARPVIPTPPTPAAPVPMTLERPTPRIEEPRRPAPREAATAPAMRLTPPEPAVPREPPPPPAPQLHIGSIHVEVMSTPPRPAPAPKPVTPAVIDRSALTGSSLLGQRFGLGQL
jgi:hypothetical protein